MHRTIPVLIALLLVLAGAGWNSANSRQFIPPSPAAVVSIPGYPCYRTIAGLNAALQQIVSDHPQIAQLETIGFSYENRPLPAIKLTNIAIPGPKPIFFLLANAHSNEALTPEAAMAFIDYLTDLYGIDADATWLLDQNDLRILVSANPDGHIQVEQGESFSWWQKNTHPHGTCSPSASESNYPGVDLNSNFGFHWYPGGFPCLTSYHGPDPASEPETQAVQDYLASTFEDYRPPDDTDPAFEDAEGIVVILQSPGERIQWPWSWSTTQAPNDQELSLLGQKLASLNGYTPQQASALGPESGTPIDWPYGELGIASFAFQIGPDSAATYPQCDQAGGIIQENLPALVYAAKVARTPYLTPQGPDAFNLRVEQSGQSWSVKALLSDVGSGGNSIAEAEYYLDSYPWTGGVPHAMLADDGAFDEETEPASGPFPVSELSPGKHMILVRGRDNSGNWGPLSAIFYTVITDSTITGWVNASVSDQPLPGAQIIFDGSEMTASTETDEEGHYSAAVRHGVYTATVSANGYSVLVVPGIQAEIGQTTSRNFSLSPLPPDIGAIDGLVRDAGSNLPLEAQVSLLNTAWKTTSNGESGYYLLPGIPSGVYTLTASASGYLTATIPEVAVQSGQTTRQDISLASLLPRPYDLQLSLSGPNGCVYPGGQYLYTIQVKNSSADPLIEVVMTASLPAEVDFVSASPPVDEQSGVVTWMFPTLDDGGEKYLYLAVRVKADVPVGTTIRMDAYRAWAKQIPGGVAGQNPIDVVVGCRLFLPSISK